MNRETIVNLDPIVFATWPDGAKMARVPFGSDKRPVITTGDSRAHMRYTSPDGSTVEFSPAIFENGSLGTMCTREKSSSEPDYIDKKIDPQGYRVNVFAHRFRWAMRQIGAFDWKEPGLNLTMADPTIFVPTFMPRELAFPREGSATRGPRQIVEEAVPFMTSISSTNLGDGRTIFTAQDPNDQVNRALVFSYRFEYSSRDRRWRMEDPENHKHAILGEPGETLNSIVEKYLREEEHVIPSDEEESWWYENTDPGTLLFEEEIGIWKVLGEPNPLLWPWQKLSEWWSAKDSR